MSDWPECGDKVDYLNEGGYKQTAYLDQTSWNRKIAIGTHKHTDRLLVLVWDDGKEIWREVASTDAEY